MKTAETDYNRQAKDFLRKTNTTFKAEFLKNDYHFADDESRRDIYKITLKRNDRKFSFNFGQSIKNSIKFEDKITKRQYTASGKSAGRHNYKYLYPENFPKNKAEERFSEFRIIQGTPPTEYDVLACLTKYPVETFEDFCGEFGYDTDSRKAEKTYKAVLNEWQNVAMLWSDEEIEELQEIQ